MRHQTKRKYADRKNLNRKYHPQKAYRKQQKRKTGWRARWDKFTDRLANIFGIDFLILLPVVIIYGIFFGHDVYKDDIYGLWQPESHQLAISYERGGEGSKIDWEIVQDGNVLIKNARIDDIKRLEDGTLYIEVYAEERLLSNLPTKHGYNYLNMYVRKDHYLTYNGESYKRIDDRDKTITWKDGSTSVYGERKTFFDYIEPFLFWGMMGALFLSCIVICWRNIKSKK